MSIRENERRKAAQLAAGEDIEERTIGELNGDVSSSDESDDESELGDDSDA